MEYLKEKKMNESVEEINLSNEDYEKDLDLLHEKKILKNIVKIGKSTVLKYSSNYNATHRWTAEV